ncbi:MAG: ATP-binding cassette domain-containing protein [Halobacteriota archaeon]
MDSSTIDSYSISAFITFAPICEIGSFTYPLWLKKYYLSASRGVVKAVDDVSFEINENEIFGVVGHSSAGKTSLMKIVSHLDAGSGGSARVRIGDR